MTSSRPLPPAPPADRKSPAASDLRRMSSDTLFGGAGELVIEHRGVEYRLRRTAQDKLILTK